jgi:hypothetical protein
MGPPYARGDGLGTLEGQEGTLGPPSGGRARETREST